MRIALLCLVVLGCAHAPPRPELAPPADDDPRAAASPAPAPAQPAPARAPDEIPRQALIAVLDAGPGAFLQGVRVRAALAADAFRGWEIVDLRDERMRGAGLQPHDLVTAVNGQSIERPEQLGAIWDALRSAPELTVDYLRDGEARRLRFAIRD